MRPRSLLAVTLALLLPATAAPALSTPAPTAVRLAGHVPAWAVPAARVGSVAPDEPVEVQVLLRWRDPAGAARLAARVSDPADPAYGEFVTAAEFRRRHAPAPATVASVQGWLRSGGLEVGRVLANRMLVPARGPAHRVTALFGTGFARYAVEGLTLRAPLAGPLVPSALRGHVAGVRGLDESARLVRPGELDDPVPGVDEPPTPADTPPPAAVLYAPPCSKWHAEKVNRKLPKLLGGHQPYVSCGTTPAQLRAAYGVPKGLDGAGQTIVMTGSHAVKQLPRDLAEWSKRRGVPALKPGQLRQISHPGAYQTPVSGNVLRPTVWAVQTATLFEHIRAVAPAANLVYVGSTSSLDIVVATLVAVDGELGNVVVNGWYTRNENVPDPEIRLVGQIAEQAAATGISLVFSSGERGDGTRSGESDPVVVFPAHHPNVTAVGTTSLLLGRNGRYLRELGWAKVQWTLEDGVWEEAADDTFRASGGGVSEKHAQPAYQRGVVPAGLAERNANGPGRTLPDVAVAGDAETALTIGYTMRFPDGKDRYAERRLASGTAATALFGAFIALANQRAKRDHGFVNPALYAMWKAHRDAFRDIVPSGRPSGGVRVDYENGADGDTLHVLKTFEEFTSNVPARGYDTATGLGSPAPAFWRWF